MTPNAIAESDRDRIRRHLVELGAGALAEYKSACFGRRLASRLRIHRLGSVAAYADLLDRDPGERGKLLSALAIGVTSFFRNPPAWRRLVELVAAEGRGRPIAAWSAGCATGEEAYSLAMVLASLARSGRIGRWSVLGTDVDARSLAVARAGSYPDAAAAAIEGMDLGPAGVVAEGRLTLASELRDGVTFRQEDLLGSGPRSRFDLVVCRNVLIYFGREGQDRALGNLTEAVTVGGLLMLGKAELAATAPLGALEPADRRERIYRRIR